MLILALFWTILLRKFSQIFRKGGEGTVGENHEFRVLWTSLLFQVVSCELDVNLLEHIKTKIQVINKRYFKLVL